ncbi:MAG: ribonuclease III [Caldilineaceae bacterium]|nr:ribonuclease III [Caldilineaceae bacterium]MDE0080252.1 ribonuclease III [Caldilineaceae bacterium]
MEHELQTLSELEEAVGVRFKDRALLQRAFVHRSYLHEADEDSELQDNQRLEFLGDAVLSFVVSELLFRRYPGRREGELTNLRSALVKRETLSRFAKELGLGDYLLLGRGEEESGGRRRHTTLCDTYESFIGAFYLDQGIAALRAFLEPRLVEEIGRVAQHALTKDPKSRLQEWVQAATGQTPRYRTVNTEGPDHARLFTRQVTIGKQPYGVGQGQSKQEAEQAAAAMALFRLGQTIPGYEDSGLAEEYELASVEKEEVKSER